MQNYQDIQDLTKCTVAIKRSGNGITLGTGVIVTDDGLILTCYHVIGDHIHKKIIDKDVDIYFPSIHEIKRHASIVDKYCEPELDIAFLQLQEKLPEQSIVAELGDTIYPKEHAFQSFGFRNPEGTTKFEGLPANGTIQAKTRRKSKDGTTLSPLLIALKSDQIAKGMSGAPVLDTEINKVVGIISDRYDSRYLSEDVDIYKTLSFAIPVESIIEVCSGIKENNPGLRPISNFLRKIDLENTIYRRFDDLYVYPLEYEEIEKALREHRVIFITGTKEYGKTFTAIKLLWEYCKKNYEPKYIWEREEELSEILERLKNLDDRLRHHIIYFEDPVGKTEYVPNEKFENNIGRIIDVLARVDVYIIITIREEIYKKFSPIGKVDLLKFVKRLNIRSYDYERRKEMLLKWAEVMKCEWFQSNELKNTVLESIKHETKLSTPLNIKDFIMATSQGHDNVTDKQKLLDIMDTKSKETAEVFANEIKDMTKDKILFLSFPFISDEFLIEFVKTKYQELLNMLNIKNDEYLFKRVIRDFEDDKIAISGEHLRFAHPSYSEALPYLLLDDDEIPTEINTEIFSKVLLKLADDSNAAADVSKAVSNNFDKLPDNIRNELLLKLAENKQAAWYVAYTINYNFDKLPDNVRNELLLKLAENKQAAWYMSHADNVGLGAPHIVAANFDKLPDNVRNLLFKLADDEEVAEMVASAVGDNFNKLPGNVRNLLFKLADDAGSYVAFAVADNFDELPDNVRNELLLKISDDKRGAPYIAKAISSNFDKLPEKVQSLLFKLADNKYAANSVAYAVADNFDKLPENTRNELLLKLTKSSEAVRYLSEDLRSKSDKLPQHIRDKLFKE